MEVLYPNYITSPSPLERAGVRRLIKNNPNKIKDANSLDSYTHRYPQLNYPNI